MDHDVSGIGRYIRRLLELTENPRSSVRSPARIYGYASAAAVVVLIVYFTHSWLGSTDWAGLGQWIGGLGAFYAAAVALKISGREARDRAKAEAREDFMRANFVVCHHQNGVLVISNRSREPVTDVVLTAYHLGERRQPMDSAKRELLLPAVEPYTHQFEYKPAHGMSDDEVLRLLGQGAEMEFEFTDLHGNRWVRRGDRVVRPAAGDSRRP
ncbi:hypothetical protein ACIRSS_37955 [Amycolatopsis sp. NPDC101161]|uniref:hypothetical protein n=1 Tax=Amycolatopsis sp. NPDC101161 TaxID=3363940 RepID=UPI00382C6704